MAFPKGNSVSGRVYEVLRSRIIEGQYQAGEKITIDRVATEAEVSLIPVREALARLNAERLVILYPNRGYFIAPELELKEIEDLFRARVVLEVGAIRQLQETELGPSLEELKRLNQAIRKGVSRRGKKSARRQYHEFVELNERFHEVIVNLSKNNWLVKAHQDLHFGVQISRSLHGFSSQDLDKVMDEHEAIIQSLAKGDWLAAENSLTDHILDGGARVMEVIIAQKNQLVKTMRKPSR